MSKSVYSLVLSDDIVRAADNMAYKMGISRSALIDRVLAEHLGISTPEAEMRNIIESIAGMFDDEIFRLQTSANDGGMLIRSPLPFKYKPTIRYSVELLRDSKYLGKLKISFRTQNSTLSLAMHDFLHRFLAVESKYIGNIIDIYAEIENDKMTRMLSKPAIKRNETVSSDDIAKAIAEYVSFVDKLIKIYFEHLDNKSAAVALMDKAYAVRMDNVKILL